MSETRATALVAVLASASAAFTAALLPGSIPEHPAAPTTHRENGYVGSGACQSCHPSEHDSWSKTFHRTMTRRASALHWNGEKSPRLPHSEELYGRRFSLHETSEGAIEYTGPDLHQVGEKLPALGRQGEASQEWKLNQARSLFSTAREVTRQLVLVTGSHHYLAFWIEGGADQELRQFPFVYLLDEERWLARKDAFLQPPDALPHLARWNANCIQCHTVAGKPQQSEGTASDGSFWESYDTKIAEEGISCEACHGPGKEHTEHYRNPVERVRARAIDEVKSIFVPSPDKGGAASETCGQCHSYFLPKNPDEWWNKGFSAAFHAGQHLGDSRSVVRADSSAALSRGLSTIFWDDGSIMVGGREYNGLSKSPCFEGKEQQKLACTSCHSMHTGDPDQQLDPRVLGDSMCTQCHDDVTEEHTRHAPDSPGARCVNCHMPRTSYALLHGIPSHQIGSPKPNQQSPPNACSLCHVDRTRSWITEQLSAYSNQPGEEKAAAEETTHESEIPWAIERALSGHAGVRAIYASALGRPETLETAGSAVANQLLPLLKDDPYAAIQLIAARSERSIQTVANPAPRAKDPHFTPLAPATISKLIDARENRPIVISE